MQSLVVPAGGLTLTSSPLDNPATDPAKSGVKPVQVMQLDLESTVLDDIIETVLTSGKEPRLTFGKSTTVSCVSRSITFNTNTNVARFRRRSNMPTNHIDSLPHQLLVMAKSTATPQTKKTISHSLDC